MKKSRIIALLTAVAMIMSIVPVFAADMSSASYIVSDDGTVLEKIGDNLVPNPGFEEGLTGIAGSSEYYEISDEYAHSGNYSLKALQSTKGTNSLSAAFSVSDPGDSYYLSFWYLNTDEVARRPRVTFAFTDSLAVPPTDEDFIDETNSWVAAGTASNDQGMAYSKGEWVQYSTIITGNGNAVECAKVLLQIYGLTKELSYVDDIEIYRLSEASEYNAVFAAALSEWESNSVPSGPLAGIGKLELTREIKSVSGVSVEWSSSSDLIDAETGDYVSGASSSLAVLTARVYIDGFYDEIYKDYEYAYIIKSMFEPYINLVNADFDSFGSSVSGNLKLEPSKSVDGYYPATIEWVCSDPEVIASDGTFTAPETTKYVDLSAVITCGEDSYTVSRRIKALGGNIIPNGLVMYYDFESEISKNTVADASGNGNNASATGGVTVADGYAYFNGVDSTLTLPSNYGSNLPGSYSVSMWVKLDKTIESSAAMYRFFDLGGDSYNSQFLRYVPSSGQLSFMDRGTVTSGSEWALNATLSGIADSWKLVTLVYDFSTNPAIARVYIDGEYFASSSGSSLTRNIATVAGASSMTGYIGRTQWNNADNPDFKGYMDDVRIYDRVLAEDEVRTLYTETRPTVTANVTIKYVDLNGDPLFDNEGRLLAPDVVVQYDVDSTYDVPSNLKSVASYSDDSFRYSFKYIASKSEDSVYVTTSGENVCTLVFELTKSVKGTNLIENGSFEDGTAGWTNRLGTDIVGATVEYDGDIGANAMCIQTMGKDSTQSIGTIWKVEVGKTYTLSFDVGGTKPEESNYGYNRISDSYNYVEGHYENAGNDLVKFGEEMTDGTWTHFEKTFVAQTDTVYIQSSWAAGIMKFANFVLEENTSGGDTPDEPGDETGIPVIIRFFDSDGNKIKDDVETSVSQGTKTYTVSSSYKTIAIQSDDKYFYTYSYNAELSTDTVSISILNDNICTLVFDVSKRERLGNLIANSSFEENADGWTSGNNGVFAPITGWIRSTEQSHDGDWSLKRNSDTGSNSNDNFCTYIQIEPGKIYKLSFWEYSTVEEAAGSHMMSAVCLAKNIAPMNDANNQIMTEGAYSSWINNASGISPRDVGYSQGWTQREFTFDTTNIPEAQYILIGYAWKTSGDFYVDDFSLKEVLTVSNTMSYADGAATITVVEEVSGYLVQAFYDEEGALTNVIISDKMEFNPEVPAVVSVEEGAKLILVKDLASLEPICPAIMAE